MTTHPTLTRLLRNFNSIEQLKFQTKPPREHLGGKGSTRRGPSTPIPTHILDADIEATQQLMELVGDAAQSIGDHQVFPHDGVRLASWVIQHEAQLTALDWWDDMLDSLEDINTQLGRVVRPAPRRVETIPRFVTAEAAARILSAKVAPVKPATIRRWASDDLVDVKGKDGKQNVYDIVQLRRHLLKVRRSSQ